MDEQTRKLMEKIEQSTHVSMDEVIRIAEAVKYSDFTDETTVRQLVKQLAYIANQPISPEKVEQIVQSIVNQNIPSSMDELQRYFK